MPLPNGGTWPPREHQPIYDLYAIHSAWYTGDPDELARIYGNPSAGDLMRPPNRPSTYRGGLVGTIARWFWGAPQPRGERRVKLHVPIAADLSGLSADLLYSEPPAIRVSDAATQTWLDEQAEQIHAALLEAAEVGAALGGAYLRICWDTQVSSRPWIAPVHADCAVPEWRWGRLHAVTFWRVLEQDGPKRLVHLERHEPGAILHGLYEGTAGDLGRQVDLSAHPETAGLPPVVETGIPLLTAAYLPNIRPQRRWRNYPAGANLGRSDFDGLEGLMDRLDAVYTSLVREIDLAKARLIVPRAYLQNLGPGAGSYFDADRELYEAVDALPSESGGLEIAPQQFAIRVDEHLRSADALVRQIIRTAGYSAQSLGMDDAVAMTATEVKAKERRSMITRAKKQLHQRPAIVGAVEALLGVQASLFGGGVAVERPDVVFGDSVSEDVEALARTATLLRQAEAASTETLVRLVHPDWDEEQIRAEVQRIMDDRPEPVPDPFALTPGDESESEGEGPGEDGEEQADDPDDSEES